MIAWAWLSYYALIGQDALAPVPSAEPLVENLSYTYNPFGKRDPFRSFLLDLKDEDALKDPLLNFELSSFALTGIVSGISNPKAIVVDKNGRGHVIGRGTRIGRNKGQVTRILKDGIVVTEEYRDPLGKLIVNDISIPLKEVEKR